VMVFVNPEPSFVKGDERRPVEQGAGTKCNSSFV